MGDPRAIVASFARPGGNITGVTTFSTELTAKRIELLKELVPGLSRVALLHNMGNPAAPPEWEETKTAARSLGLQAELLDVRSQGDLGRAFELAARQHVDALVIGADGLTQMHQQTIVDLVARNRLPAAYPAREFVEAGGLIAYAVNYPDLYFRFASFVDKIFKGAKPGELPGGAADQVRARRSTSKTAKALGLMIPRIATAARRRGDRMRRRTFIAGLLAASSPRAARATERPRIAVVITIPYCAYQPFDRNVPEET